MARFTGQMPIPRAVGEEGDGALGVRDRHDVVLQRVTQHPQHVLPNYARSPQSRLQALDWCALMLRPLLVTQWPLARSLV
jgi:hypothetical protein